MINSFTWETPTLIYMLSCACIVQPNIWRKDFHGTQKLIPRTEPHTYNLHWWVHLSHPLYPCFFRISYNHSFHNHGIFFNDMPYIYILLNRHIPLHKIHTLSTHSISMNLWNAEMCLQCEYTTKPQQEFRMRDPQNLMRYAAN